MNTQTSTRNYRIFLLPAIIALLMNLVIGPLAPIIQDGASDVFGALVFTNDENGANDEPGQKDLTRLGIDYAGLPTSVRVIFNLDDTAWSGNNSGDGCSLFDTDDDLNVNFALCATVKGSPAALVNVSLYACTADAKVDRCTGPSLLTQSAGTTCTAAIQASDPFPTGDFHPNDAVVDCTIALADVGASSADLVNVCSYPSQEPNSDPSDCVLIIRDGAIRVTKVVTNDNGGLATCNEFGFTINPGAVSQTFDDTPDCSNLVAVAPTNNQGVPLYTVTEPAVAGYVTTYSNCSNLNVASGETEVCTITNNDQGATLTVVKNLINNNGGTATCNEFSFSVNTGTPVTFDDSPDCTNVLSVAAGTYSVTEPAVAGYTTTYSAGCTSVVIPNGGSATCTITNDDQAGTLTVIKNLINNNGGTATCNEFSFSVNTGTPVTFDDSPDCTNVQTVSAGTYSVTEPAVSGYTTTYSAGCTNAVIPNGGSATCTITNDDQAAGLTVIKNLINDDGGTASCNEFSFRVNGGSAVTFDDSPDCTNVQTVDAGTYSVTEPAVSGYTTTYSAGCTNAVIPNGGSATCTITNDDQPGTLTVVKVIAGGNDSCNEFSFRVNGGSAVTFDDSPDCTNVQTVDAGTYSVTEPAVSGYTTTYSAGCTNAVIPNGGSATCTITNTRQTGGLEVVKDLIPAGDGGKFSLQIDGVTDPDATNVGDGGSTGQQTLDTGVHNVGEIAGTSTDLDNYASSIVCHDGNGLGAKVAEGAGAGPLNVNVTNGSDIVCVITNTRVTVGFNKADDNGENDRNVEPGETIHYTLSVIVNTGTATGVEVTDTLPDGLTYVADSADPSAGFSVNGQDLTWTVGSLAAGTYTFEYDATVDADAVGPLTNLGCVDADQNDLLVCDSTTLLVQHITVIKTNGSGANVVPGTAVDFTLTLDVTNGPIDNVTIVDDLPTGIANATLISDGGIYDATANTITWTLTNVVDNETLTYRAVVSATATAGSLTNVATITDGPCAPDCDDESTVIVRVPTLVTDKVASTETITISGPANALVATPSVVTWTVSYTLTNGPVTGAVIKDQVPTGLHLPRRGQWWNVRQRHRHLEPRNAHLEWLRDLPDDGESGDDLSHGPDGEHGDHRLERDDP